MDSGATFHIHANEGIFNSFNSNCNIISVMVGDRSSINVTKTGSSILCTVDMYRTLHLHNILITPQIIKTLVYVRKFTKDNHCSIKFDAFGFSMKDFVTKQVLLRCDSTDDPYPITAPSSQVFVVIDPPLWHQHVGHPGDKFFQQLISSKFI